jgi:hypothetical protein
MSFRRNKNKSLDIESEILKGVKPWLNCGLGIVSTGLRELDEYIGGGLPLGTISLFLTDSQSNFGSTIINYNIVECITIGHKCLITTLLSDSFNKIIKELPFNLNFSNLKDDYSFDDSASTQLSELKLANSYKIYIGKSWNK